MVAAYRNAANSALRIVQESERTRATLEGQYEDQRFKERTNLGIETYHAGEGSGDPSSKLGLGGYGQQDSSRRTDGR